MKVLTENPIVVIKAGMPLKGIYSPADGDYSNAGGKIVKKAKSLVGSGKVQGVLGALSGGGPGAPVSAPPPPPEPTGMSTGAKVGIAVGAVAALAIIIYIVKKKK